MSGDSVLVVRRKIEATPEELFSAWTDRKQLVQWWGPQGVTCTSAEVDARVGGRYRIGNRLPSGEVLWIAGVFERVSPPNELIFTWQIEGRPAASERVIVRFKWDGSFTEVMIEHQRIGDATLRDQHEAGWIGCLEGLSKYVTAGGRT